MDNKNMFAIRMRETRIKKGISQAELSRITGISPSTLARYESEDKPKSPPIDKALTIANAFDVSLDWMCGLDNQNDYNDEPTTKEIFDAIITLSKIPNSKIEAKSRKNGECEDTVVIKLFGDGFYDCVKELMKVKYLMDDPDYPDYLKLALKSAIYDKFADLLQLFIN